MASEEKAFEIITEICTENFNSSEYKNPVEIRIRDDEAS